MSAIRKALDVVTDWLSQVHTDHPDMSTQAGEEVDSVVLTPTANEFERAYIILDYLQKIQSLDGFESIINDDTYKQDLADALGTKIDGSAYSIEDVEGIISLDINKLVNNWGITRNYGAAASGYVRFMCLTSNAVTIPKGFLVRTAGYPFTEYTTVTAVNNEDPQYDATIGYYIDVYVSCTVNGTAGNIPANAIKLLSASISNVTGVYNISAFSNGDDSETNQELINRARDAWTARNLGTETYFRNILIGQNGVDDISVVKSGDTLMQRMDYGAVDIYIRCSKVLNSITEVFIHQSGRQVYTLNKQPADSIISVTINSTPLVQNTDYILLKGEQILGSDYSTRGSDALMLINPAIYNSYDGNNITVNYYVVSNVEQSQNIIDSEENRCLFDDALIKLGFSSLLDINLAINIKAGYDATVVRSNVEYNLNMFISGGKSENGVVYDKKSFNSEIQVSDLINVITTTTGVDQLVLGSFSVSKVTHRPGGTAYAYPPDEVIYFDKTEYPVLGTVTWL